ncbi:O-methyltransferase family protein [Caballeronia sordidicola]|uniref:O-methyltransferase family protein n=1 Tax=Caballeronia sordidicola TaxID=196367 RepID=A0A158HZX3_CABSO|nr:class I SAM-dependent methyltransferase [Caballeronia sordidicola]SAL49858.1 O-methyltransferase family protein [Caballeronia sordidicola]
MDHALSNVLYEYDVLLAEEQKKRESGGLMPKEGQRDERFLAVGPQTGQLINLLARSLEKPTILELGTSYGYSTIWLADAARASSGKVLTMELADYKSVFARDMVTKAGLACYVDYRVGDAVAMIADVEERVDFVLLDLWKDLYVPCLSAFVPKLNEGAIIVADNISRNREHAAKYCQAVRSIPGMSSFSVPVGQGLELSRYKAF